MKELRRNLQDAVDSLTDEAEEIQTNIDAKKDEVLVAQSELSGLKTEFQRKQNEIDRAEKALAMIQGKRTRN